MDSGTAGPQALSAEAFGRTEHILFSGLAFEESWWELRGACRSIRAVRSPQVHEPWWPVDSPASFYEFT